MSFRKIDLDIMLKGAVLAIVETVFPEGPPSLVEYAKVNDVAESTFRRAGQWLLGPLRDLLSRRRPGPKDAGHEGDVERQEAVRKLQDLWAWVEKNRRHTRANTCYSPEAKRRIATLSEEIQDSGVMTFAEIAQHLGIDVRQLNRIRAEVAAAGGQAPEEKSRRPEHTAELAAEIQELIRTIQASANSKEPYGPTDIKRILEKNYKAQLEKHHGGSTIAKSTVKRYMEGEPPATAKPVRPRGGYRYPEPFQQVAIDTSHFKLFGWTFYFITVFEMAGRLNLLTRVFLRERITEVVAVVEEYLERFPGIEVVVIDRGTPYLNDRVKELLASHGRLRIVCPPATPTAKAACERHFKTLKTAIGKVVKVVFRRRPTLSAAEIATALEFGAAVFQELYHQIPQEGIDGKSPAERIESFDPVRVAAAMVEQFERALAWEPAEEMARRIHAHFQLPNPEAETVKRLRQFGTPVLRRLLEEVSSYMGPPFPYWMWDPLGYLAAQAHRLWEEEQQRARARKRTAAEAQEERAARARRDQELEAERREWNEHPERFVDGTLEALVRFTRSGFAAGARVMARKLGELLESLAEKLGRVFPHEVARLEARACALAGESWVAEDVIATLDRLLRRLPVAAPTG